MQDPVFNSMDKTLLQSLGYSLTTSPGGLDKVNHSTFLFAPHLEWPVYVEALKKASPSLCIGNDIREYIESPFNMAPTERRQCLRSYLDDYCCRVMPSFERCTWCDSTSIYWRRPTEDDYGASGLEEPLTE